MTDATKLPRQLAPDLFWGGPCAEITFAGRYVHSHISFFVIKGAERTLMIDCGRQDRYDGTLAHLRAILGDRDLDLILPTHLEPAHCGNLPFLLDEFPNARAIGDLRNGHLFFPRHSDRFELLRPGDSIDLGESRVRLLPAIMRDLPDSVWVYAHASQALFVADAFGFMHQHEAGECAVTSSEMPDTPDPMAAAMVAANALYWSRYVDTRPLFESLGRLLQEYPARLIAPAHGAVITDPARVLPVLNEGLELARQL